MSNYCFVMGLIDRFISFLTFLPANGSFCSNNMRGTFNKRVFKMIIAEHGQTNLAIICMPQNLCESRGFLVLNFQYGRDVVTPARLLL